MRCAVERGGESGNASERGDMEGMSWASSEAVSIFTFLLPGFLAAMIFYSLTSYPVPSAFDRLIHTLIFTTVGQALASFIVLLVWGGDPTDESLGWNNIYDLVLSVAIASGLALVSAYVLNNDILHRLFRRIGVTRETSYPFELYSTFSQHRDCYVVLHLSGQRRLYGWPAEWPSHPGRGHFRILEAEWLTDNGAVPAAGVSAILIPATQVEIVEFLRMETNEKE